jgi:hypothetical protein
MADFRTRRQRRARKARLRHGRNAAPKHKLLHGRTGAYWHKLTRSSSAHAYSSHRPSLTLSDVWNIG